MQSSVRKDKSKLTVVADQNCLWIVYKSYSRRTRLQIKMASTACL